MSETPALLNTRGAADHLGVGYSTLRKMTNGPQPVQVGRSIRYRTADLDAWVAALPQRVVENSEKQEVA